MLLVSMTGSDIVCIDLFSTNMKVNFALDNSGSPIEKIALYG